MFHFHCSIFLENISKISQMLNLVEYVLKNHPNVSAMCLKVYLKQLHNQYTNCANRRGHHVQIAANFTIRRTNLNI
jgi:hypothetical protein